MAFYVPARKNRHGIAHLSVLQLQEYPADTGGDWTAEFSVAPSSLDTFTFGVQISAWLDMRLSVSSGWQASVHFGLNRMYTILADNFLCVGSENGILFM